MSKTSIFVRIPIGFVESETKITEPSIKSGITASTGVSTGYEGGSGRTIDATVSLGV